jgi:hypothetical protein
MLKIDNSLLVEIGLGSLPEAEKNSFLKHIYETLEMRVGVRLADQMTNEQLDEFERYFEAKDDAGAFKWLETNFPNYKEIVQQEFDKLKAEVAQSAPQILATSQAAQHQAQPQAQVSTPPPAPTPAQPAFQPAQQQPPAYQQAPPPVEPPTPGLATPAPQSQPQPEPYSAPAPPAPPQSPSPPTPFPDPSPAPGPSPTPTPQSPPFPDQQPPAGPPPQQ